jgi:hypothetical protein
MASVPPSYLGPTRTLLFRATRSVLPLRRINYHPQTDLRNQLHQHVVFPDLPRTSCRVLPDLRLAAQ